MDESPMSSHALGTAEFADSGGAPSRRMADLPWRNYTRCFLIAAVLFAAGYIAFRPGLLRFSIIMSLVSPSRGESLAWKPEPEEEARPAPTKFTPTPGEWRLAAAHTAGWPDARPSARDGEWRGGSLGGGGWQRESFNPWSWSDDAARAPRRGGSPENAPAQKAESPFRAREAADWLAATAPAATSTQTPASIPAQTQTPAPAFAEASPERVPSVAPLSPLSPLTPPAPLPPLSSIPPLAPLAPLEPITPAAPAAPAAPESEPAPAVASAPIVPEAVGTISPAQALSAAFAATPSTTPTAPEAPVNWLESEITAPIPGAYLTIYPKLKFIGLCVPGQGYIRKYNQIAAPMDPATPKQHAADGRTPYGKYYVAEHLRDGAGPRVVLSWPSVDDARRAGAGAEMLGEIERAWQRQAMPPQDSLAGGGLSLAGDRATTEFTSGGFSLEAPHMEEIFTALPNGAWVFIQE